MKKHFVLVVTIVFMFCMTAYAKNSDKMDTNKLRVDISEIEDNLKEMIINDYSEIYELNNFEFDYSIRKEEKNIYIDINVFADMALIRKPEESPFILGMKNRMYEETVTQNQAFIESEIDIYLDEINSYYLKPERTTFTYTAVLDSDNRLNSALGMEDVSLYYRTDTYEEVILTAVERLSDVEDPISAMKAGYEVADTAIDRQDNQEKSMRNSSFIYDRVEARDWARDNAFATPEYPSSIVEGTDCANFVSKALNAGGIPEDSSGDWYRASTWGGWPGDNWLRTGYYNNGGVVPYMTGKYYFYKQNDESKVYAGSIMYWNSTSHVALVTYGDTVVIKYTQHGGTQSKDTVYRSEDASFYMPYDSIQ